LQIRRNPRATTRPRPPVESPAGGGANESTCRA
jgi:hypothetical protein